MAKTVPKDWIGCPTNGTRLIASKFMTLKTPLSSQYDKQLKPNNFFHPEDIFERAERNNVQFGLWIDLTNTSRYYTKDDIEKQGCEYVKIACTGHGQCPSRIVTRHFISVVHHFIIQNPHKCIVVHCTHGFNRTGFLITSFLVENLDFNIHDAVMEFASARPPGIYRQNYIKELFLRYGWRSDIPIVPSIPQWVDTKTCGKRNRRK